MFTCVDHWMPFRVRNPEQNRGEILDQIQRRLLTPLTSIAELATKACGPGDDHLLESLASTLSAADDLTLITEEFASIRSLDDVMSSWRQQLRPFEKQGGQVKLQTFGKIPEPRGDQLRHLHLVVRESIGNSIRHAAASRIELIVAPWEDGCAVTLADNGRGISSSAAQGLGLASMERRVARAGGNMARHQNNGTIMEFMLPSRPRSFWDWLRQSGRLETGISGSALETSIRIWDARQAEAGSLQRWFQKWPGTWESEATPPVPQLAAWLDQQTAGKGIKFSSDSGTRRKFHFWTCHWQDEVDPLHWLELGERIARTTPLLIQGSGGQGWVSFAFAEREEDLPAPNPDDSFLDHIHFAWAQGLEGPSEELSSHLHDNLAQQLVAESMHWEIAREQSSEAARRETCDRLCHGFRQLAVDARSLSHEIAAS